MKRQLRRRTAVCLVLAASGLGGGCASTRSTVATNPPPSAAESSKTAPTSAVTRSLETAPAPPRITAASYAVPAEPSPSDQANPTGAAQVAQPAEISPAGVASSDSEAQAAPYPIDFASALAIAAGESPQVAFSRQRISEAYAQLQAAEALWVPSLRAGMNYNKHEGTIQDVAGNMIETSRGSVYSGLGAQAVGAGSPAVPGVVMNFHTTDAIFQPRINRQVLAATHQANRATTNDILLQTALAYNDLLEAHQVAAISQETLTNSQRLAKLTADYADTGEGLPADADRAQTELATRQIEVQRADESVQVASIRLARVLSQDPTITLAPQEPALAPIELAECNCALPELIATGLTNRPELAENRHLVGAAVEKLRREKSAPLIPSVLLGLSYGANGGGLGDEVSRFGDRMDFDAVAYWELRNLGWGERAARGKARASVEQTRWRQVQLLDQVASEIAEAHVQLVARRRQIESAQTAITAARQSYRRNAERIQEGLGLPLEVLQSLQALDGAQRQYVRAVADYNRAQFQLQRALGWPVADARLGDDSQRSG